MVIAFAALCVIFLAVIKYNAGHLQRIKLIRCPQCDALRESEQKS